MDLTDPNFGSKLQSFSITSTRHTHTTFQSHHLQFQLKPKLCHQLNTALETCDSLPAFGQLPNLRHFSMKDMTNIRKIGKEFFGEEGNCKKLRVISLERMANLGELWTTRSGKDDEEFLIPNLHYLKVVKCPKLSFLPYTPRSINWTVVPGVARSPERGFGSLASSTLPFCVTIKNCHFSHDRWGRLQHLATLEIFQGRGCSGLRTLPDAIQCLLSLRELYLESWEDLEILPEWLGQLVFMKKLVIRDSPKLTLLPESMENLTALRKLELEGCEGLEILPEGLGQLTSMTKLVIKDCPKMTLLPESMENLTALIELQLVRCKGLETLPEGLGLLISLENLYIYDCPKLKSLPKSIQNLTALRQLWLEGCEGLEISPELFGHQLTSLKVVRIRGCPNLTYLPESTKNLTALEVLWLGGFNSLPEWIGQFICLKDIRILDSPDMTFLPESIRNLTSLKELHIWNCPRLIERCQGEDASNISNIPRIVLHGEIFIPGQAFQGSKNTAECGHSSQDREHKQERQDEEKLYMHVYSSDF
ncbi:LOW QUALITY PROTEIN: disease resistance protein RPP2B-like [Oryza glaberrima]|uniref:LOW QUALITY PROTEIN: disease resistance protein RPP2B-like n=1 Tax=Oryza glaberrima TaxID=4538 RepID=UPI00224C0ABF|nr:LOW QUALITY PROTEIN: disease resistance protein RPP2B-like [Oryza glaberrima]